MFRIGANKWHVAVARAMPATSTMFATAFSYNTSFIKIIRHFLPKPLMKEMAPPV